MLAFTIRPLARILATVAGALTLGSAAVSSTAGAQIAGVLTRPRVARAPGDSAAAADTTVRVGRNAAKVPAMERQRLDIQAWVDSAAGALAVAPPTVIPAPGTGSIFSTPAVPDSLRPPPAPSPTRPRGRRSTPSTSAVRTRTG